MSVESGCESNSAEYASIKAYFSLIVLRGSVRNCGSEVGGAFVWDGVEEDDSGGEKGRLVDIFSCAGSTVNVGWN